MRSLIWFRRDLRLDDNPALFNACQHADDGVVALFAITPKQWREHDEADGKVRFWLENVRSLGKSLAKLRIPLRLIETEDYQSLPSAVLAVAQQYQCSDLFFNREYEVNEAGRDDAVAEACGEAGMRVHRFHDRPIVPPANIETKEGRFYTVFTPYRRVWDQKVTELDDPLPPPKKQCDTAIESSTVPESIEGFDFSQGRPDLWKPGEVEAKKRLAKFMTRADGYDQNRDIPSTNGTSLLSPYLAAGVISARRCLSETRAHFGDELDRNDGVKTWVSELTWRDFYTHVLVGFPRVSKHFAFNQKNDSVPWRYDEADFQAWCDGQTGYPIVDAGMRQLNQSGWMHNRLRMVTAMFLTKHLLIDWRWGERHFMNQLIDGDLAANNGGWQWSASTGTDSVPYFRIFNPFSQSKRFDPEGRFIKKLCPELEDISPAALHDAKKLQQELDDKQIKYPPFIVDYKLGRQRALDEFKSVNS